jgi:hypothetical protein
MCILPPISYGRSDCVSRMQQNYCEKYFKTGVSQFVTNPDTF